MLMMTMNILRKESLTNIKKKTLIPISVMVLYKVNHEDNHGGFFPK